MILQHTRYVTFDNGPRPAGLPDECFYCQRAVGDTHTDDCVLYRKTVVIQARITYEIEVPVAWTKENLEHHRNDSTWCFLNLISEVDRLEATTENCLCVTVPEKGYHGIEIKYMGDGVAPKGI